MAKVTIQYWAAAREAAGVELESVEASTLAEALDEIVARRGDDAPEFCRAQQRPDVVKPPRARARVRVAGEPCPAARRGFSTQAWVGSQGIYRVQPGRQHGWAFRTYCGTLCL